MLKVLDAEGRLSIVDGDTDSPSVQREFERVIRQHTSRLNHEIVYRAQSTPQQSPPKPLQKQLASSAVSPSTSAPTQRQQPHSSQSKNLNDAIVEDLDNMPGTVPTISNHISLIHNNTKSPIQRDRMNNNNSSNKNRSNTTETNRVSNHVGNHVDEAKANPSKTFRTMLEEAESYSIDEA